MYIDIQRLVGCVAKAATKVVNEGLYPYEIRSELKSFSELVDNRVCILLHEKLNIKSINPEKFYGFFYSKIVLNSKSFFPMLSESASKVLTTKLADILLCFKKEKEVDVTTTSTRNISERELSGLQYLGGYVMQNLYKKIKNSKKYNCEEYQQSMSILLAGKTSNYDSLKNLKLVSALNRGGLWAITEDIQKIFIVAEKYFSLQVERKNIRYINTEDIVKNLMSFSYIKDLWKNVN